MSDSTSKVQLTDVVKEFKQGNETIHAINHISLTINRGEFTVVVGPSGSGKTTLLNLIGGLDSPTSGSVMVENQDIAKLSRTLLSELRRDRIGFVFQSYNLIPVFTALENTEFILDLQGKDKNQRTERAMSVLKEVGLEGLENRRPDQLSGGQQQRVAIARAIAAEPAIILADEPTANLDSKTAESLLDIMAELNEQKKATFLFSTHDEKVMKRAKRTIQLVDGQIHTDDIK